MILFDFFVCFRILYNMMFTKERHSDSTSLELTNAKEIAKKERKKLYLYPHQSLYLTWAGRSGLRHDGERYMISKEVFIR